MYEVFDYTSGETIMLTASEFSANTYCGDHPGTDYCLLPARSLTFGI